MTNTAGQQLKIGGEWPGLPGSRYAGISVGADGLADGHIVLLAGKPSSELSWQGAIDWATGLGNGARLPTRDESALLYANVRGEFEADWHWTGTQGSSYYAWGQDFHDGGQYYYGKKFEARARAVRRFDSFGTSVLQSAPQSDAKAEAITNALLRQILDEAKGLRSDLKTAFLADIGC